MSRQHDHGKPGAEYARGLAERQEDGVGRDGEFQTQRPPVLLHSGAPEARSGERGARGSKALKGTPFRAAPFRGSVMGVLLGRRFRRALCASGNAVFWFF